MASSSDEEDYNDGYDSDSSDDSLTPWQFSKARKQLVKDLVEGVVEGMTCRQVYESRPGIYKTRWCNFDKFSNRFYRLRSKLKGEIVRQQVDEQALLNDMALGMGCKTKDYPIFTGSIAEEFLKLDIEQGLHKTLPPRVLHQTRRAYKKLPLDVFRGHIYQITRDKKERPYWEAQKQEKEKEKIEKRRKRAKHKREQNEKKEKKLREQIEKKMQEENEKKPSAKP